MLDREKVKKLTDNVQQILEIHKQQHETMKKLLRICVKHLEDRRMLIPKETWAERKELIDALKEMTDERRS